MKTWSIPFGHLFGVELRLHFSFVFLLFFVMFLEPNDTASPGRALVLLGLVLLSVILHEAGHVMVSHTRGLAPRIIMLLPIGGVHLRDNTSKSPPRAWDETLVALAGAPMNIFAAGIGTIICASLAPKISLLTQPYVSAANLPKSFVWINVVIALLNLLPAYPLDGGKILRAFLADTQPRADGKGMSYRQATRHAVMIGQVFAMFLIFAGMRNPWLALIGFFVFVAVQIEDRSLLFQSVIENVRLEEIMLTYFSTLSPADTLEDALNKAVHSLQDDFPVIRDSDMVGVISKQHILRALREDGNGYVQSAMKKAFETASKNESLSAAFRKITRGVTMIPVVDDERLVGIVTLQNLMHSMGVLAESRKLSREQE